MLKSVYLESRDTRSRRSFIKRFEFMIASSCISIKFWKESIERKYTRRLRDVQLVSHRTCCKWNPDVVAET